MVTKALDTSVVGREGRAPRARLRVGGSHLAFAALLAACFAAGCGAAPGGEPEDETSTAVTAAESSTEAEVGKLPATGHAQTPRLALESVAAATTTTTAPASGQPSTGNGPAVPTSTDVSEPTPQPWNKHPPIPNGPNGGNPITAAPAQ